MNDSFSPRKEQISIFGILNGVVVYFILFLPPMHVSPRIVGGNPIGGMFLFLIPLLLIPIVSSFITSYLPENLFDGIISVIISGIIIILFYISSWGGIFLERLLNPAEVDQNESWILLAGGLGLFSVVLPIACVSLGGAFLGSKLACYTLNKKVRSI